jgi:hypothetical protein
MMWRLLTTFHIQPTESWKDRKRRHGRCYRKFKTLLSGWPDEFVKNRPKCSSTLFVKINALPWLWKKKPNIVVYF